MEQLIDLQLETYKETGDRFSLFVSKSGKSQADVARITGISPSTLSRISKGKQVMGKDVIQALTLSFDINPQWLETGKGIMGSARVLEDLSDNSITASSFGKLMRLKELRQAVTLEPKEMAAKLNMDETAYLNIESGKVPIGKMLSYNVIRAFGLFPIWWETGQGNMYQPKGEVTLDVVDEDEYEGVWLPFFSIPIEGGFNEMSDPETNYGSAEKIKVIVRRGENVDRNVVFTVRGQSMYPKYSEGTKIRCKKVSKSDWEYITSGVYAFSYNESFVVKRIKNNDLLEKGFIVLHSDNPDYGSTPVPIDQIHHIWKILRIIDSPPD